ncbi:MAG TPA: hypothetical protein VFS22_06285 [Flavisolibacter sp.]|nr:hypothetical protein [Flavisolibacter sp.]
MKQEDVENMLNQLQVPEPETMVQPELKIPLLSYRKSSKAGLWLLLVPVIVALTIVLKTAGGIQSDYLNLVQKLFAAIDNNAVLTFLIPLIFIGLPLAAMILNLLAICHFEQNNKRKELIITIKYRPLNIVLFLASFAVLIFFLLPDKLSF